MKTYELHITSIATFLISAWVLIMCGALSLDYLPEDLNQVVLYIIIAALLALGTYLAAKISKAEILIEIDEHGLRHKWKRKFFFSRESDIDLKWNQITDHYFAEHQIFDEFHITLPNLKRYRLYRQSVWPMEDDFKVFRSEFPKQMNDMKTALNQEIVRGKTIYEETGFKWVWIVMSVGVLLLLANAIFNGNSLTNWGTIGMLVAAVGFYWMKIRRKSKN